MLTLLLIGLLSGIITGLSPCILPVLPAVLATSVVPAGMLKPGEVQVLDRRRPFVVIGGLVTSFAIFTLLGGSLLSALGLPADLLRNIGIAAMLLVGIGFLIPAVGHLLERPFARFSQMGPRKGGSAFLFGATFGLAFVPCAGPVLATITVLAATNQVNFGLIVLTVAFSVGVAIPLLGLALAGQQMAERIKAIRSHMPLVRQITGGILVVTALAVFFGVSDQLQRLVPSYVASAQSSIEENAGAREALGSLQSKTQTTQVAPEPRNEGVAALGPELPFAACADDPSQLANCGPARPFKGIQQWLNTPGGKPLTMEGLRGKVVLVDFWTYSCINCQRTLPYLTAWDAKYRDAGLTIVGVHSPEFAFEHEVGNVIDQAAKLGVKYPIAIDNEFDTWRNYDNLYWPAHYLIDKGGVVRQVHFGEGAYDETEMLIRELLGENGPMAEVSTTAPARSMHVVNRTLETYLGSARAASYGSQDLIVGEPHVYTGSKQIDPNVVALDGQWTVSPESITSGKAAQLRLRYSADKVFLVLGGEGTVEVSQPGVATKKVRVRGSPTLYTLSEGSRQDALLTLKFTPGISAYAFTFG